MTSRTRSVSAVLRQIALCVLFASLLMNVGCVSQRAYEQIKAETREHTHALATVQENVRELDQQIAELQAANRHDDAVTSELRATIQREEELLPIMRQETKERLSSLKTQVAGLLDQSWHLARKISDIRNDSASLKAMAARYKQEMEQVQAQTSSYTVSHRISPPSSSQDPANEEDLLPPTEEPAPPQVAQTVSTTPELIPDTPVTPTPSSPSSTVEPPAAADESWIDMIFSWLLAFWNWLLT